MIEGVVDELVLPPAAAAAAAAAASNPWPSEGTAAGTWEPVASDGADATDSILATSLEVAWAVCDEAAVGMGAGGMAMLIADAKWIGEEVTCWLFVGEPVGELLADTWELKAGETARKEGEEYHTCPYLSFCLWKLCSVIRKILC